MGGVLAVVNFDGAPVDPEVLRRMAEQCAYRGPDGIQYWIQGNVGLAHLALHATQESLRENMPMLSPDGRLVLTADARVDNRPELIAALKARGQPYPPDPTDADLILAAYQCWGEECAGQIIGDYAFIIWDIQKQRLFCARDVYGVKSLHYNRTGHLFCAASEAQMIIQHPCVPRILDELSVADFLVRLDRKEGRSMFKDVWAVRSAHCLAADAHGQLMTRYWDIDPNFLITCASDAEYAARFLEIFTRCVSDRLRTPEGTHIGITMSGGMDSTSVAAVAQKLLNASPGAPHLYAATYQFDTLKECDETEYSRAMADELGIDLTFVPAENFWLLRDDAAFTPGLEVPAMAEESLTLHILELFHSSGARVWLTGHGGDSLMVGSSLVISDRLRKGDGRAFSELVSIFKKYRVSLWVQFQYYLKWVLLPFIPDLFLHMLHKVVRRPAPGWLTSSFVRRTDLQERMAQPRARLIFSERARQAYFERVFTLDTFYGPMSRDERLGGQNDLEARHPFLDRRLMEYLFAIPPEQLFRVDWYKYLLRSAMSGLLPQAILSRPGKTDFTSYFAFGLRLKETRKIEALFSTALLRKPDVIKYGQISNVYHAYKSSGKYLDKSFIWEVICFEIWLNHYDRIFHRGGKS